MIRGAMNDMSDAKPQVHAWPPQPESETMSDIEIALRNIVSAWGFYKNLDGDEPYVLLATTIDYAETMLRRKRYEER